METLSREALAEKIRSFKYWHYPFDLGNGIVITPHGGAEHVEKKLALRQFIWPAVLGLCGGSLKGLRVLDIGCNAGFWSLEAHRSGASYVLGVEARPQFVEQATLVRDALGIDRSQLDYRQLDIYDLRAEAVGRFDLVLLLRVLHHLSEPLRALECVRSVCKSYLVVDIRLAFASVTQDQPLILLSKQTQEGVINRVTKGLRASPTMAALHLMLDAVGFGDVTVIPPKPPLQKEYFDGKRALLTARVVE